MAKIPNKAKDATEEAMSAIQEALKVRDAEMKSAPARAARPVKSESDGRPDPAAARAGRIPTAPDDDLFGEVRLGENEPRRPANDDWKSMGQILQSLQPRASRTGYLAAAIASLVWVILVGVFASSALPDLRTTENLGLAILALAATLLLPMVFFFVLTHMINRSREMRSVAQSMAEVAMRLGEPEAVARESIVTVGQAIRREVAAMGDGVERALARAAELETLVHNEVSALERAYNDNEVRIRGLLEDLNRQHDNLITSAEQVRDAIKGVHLDLSQDISTVGDMVAAQVNKAAAEVAQSLSEKGEHITHTLAQTGDSMINALGERGGDLIQRLEAASYETQNAIAESTQQLSGTISQAGAHLEGTLGQARDHLSGTLAQASEQLTSSLNFKTDHIPQEFETLSENLTRMMQMRLANLTNDFAHRATNIVEQMTERSEEVTAGYLDTSSRLAEAIALRGDEVNNTIKATGESLILDLSLRGGDVATRLEETATRITDSLLSRSNASVDAFKTSAEMLATSVGERGDAVRDMLTGRLQAFEEMFTHGGAQLAEKIGHDSATLGNLITKNLSEFDRTVKTYGGELIERLGERTDKVVEAMSSHIDNFDGRVTTKVDEITGNLDQKLLKFNEALDSRSQNMTEALDSRSQALTETMSNRVMDIARTLADGGKEVVGALDKRIDDITNTINTRGQRLAETIDAKVGDIDRTLGNRALEVAGTLDDRIGKFEELLVGRAEKLSEQVETRTRAATGALDASNNAIRNSTENLERMLMTVSSAVGEGLKQSASEVEHTLMTVSSTVGEGLKQNAGEVERTLMTVSSAVGEGLKQNAGEVERTLLGVSAEVTRSFVGKADEIGAAVKARAEEMTRILDSSSSTLLSSLTSKSQEFTAEVGRATQDAVSAIEAKGFDFTRSMLDNSGELARLINEAGEVATHRVNDTLNTLHATAHEAIEKTQTTTAAAVSEMIETHNMLRTDTTSLFERLREANILLQEGMSGSQENLSKLETALTARVSEFADVMNEVTARTDESTTRVAFQVAAFKGVTTGVVEDLGSLAKQFDSHGRALAQAVELIDLSNRKSDTSVDERRATFDSMIATLDIKSEELEQRLKRFSTLLDESLENSAARARDIGHLIAEASTKGTQNIAEQFELVRNSAEQESKRTKDAMHSIYEQTMGDSNTIFQQSTERVAEVLKGIKDMAAEMQNELEITRTELRKTIFEMPQETAETTAQMRRVIVEQVEALVELNRIVARHGNRMEGSEPRRAEPALTVIGGGRSAPASRSAARPNTPVDLPEPPLAPPAQRSAARPTTPVDLPEAPPAPRARRAPANDAPPLAPPAPAKQGTGWLSDLLQRASRDDGGENNLRVEERPARSEERQARHSIESLDALSVDIARMIDHDAASELWDRYNRGERNVFTRRLYTLQGQQAFDEIRKRYRADREFKQTVDRYIAEFERLLEDVSRDDRGQVMVRTYLTSETGKVYTMLAHAAGRFD